jgi:hypothetical protein
MFSSEFKMQNVEFKISSCSLLNVLFEFRLLNFALKNAVSL